MNNGTNKTDRDRINTATLLALGALKFGIAQMIEAGGLLSEVKGQLGDNFADFVRTQLPIDLPEAEAFVALFEAGHKAEQFGGDCEVRFVRVMTSLDQITTTYKQHAQPKWTTDSD